MSSQLPTELEAFHEFIAQRLRSGHFALSPEEAVVQFRAYEEESVRFQRESHRALRESLDGKTSSLEVEKLKREVRERLSKSGIRE